MLSTCDIIGVIINELLRLILFVTVDLTGDAGTVGIVKYRTGCLCKTPGRTDKNENKDQLLHDGEE